MIFEVTSIPVIVWFCDLKYSSIFWLRKIWVFQYILDAHNKTCCFMTAHVWTRSFPCPFGKLLFIVQNYCLPFVYKTSVLCAQLVLIISSYISCTYFFYIRNKRISQKILKSFWNSQKFLFWVLYQIVSNHLTCFFSLLSALSEQLLGS